MKPKTPEQIALERERRALRALAMEQARLRKPVPENVSDEVVEAYRRTVSEDMG